MNIATMTSSSSPKEAHFGQCQRHYPFRRSNWARPMKIIIYLSFLFIASHLIRNLLHHPHRFLRSLSLSISTSFSEMEEKEKLLWMKKSRQKFLQGNNKKITSVMMHRDYWICCAETLTFSSKLQFH